MKNDFDIQQEKKREKNKLKNMIVMHTSIKLARATLNIRMRGSNLVLLSTSVIFSIRHYKHHRGRDPTLC